MAETPSEADRSPFRRFPCGPALLCAACLAMAAWTWMRYSYAWDVTPDGLVAAAKTEDLESYLAYFLRLRGESAQRAGSLALTDQGAALMTLDEDRHVYAYAHVPTEFWPVGIPSTWPREKVEAYRERQSQRLFIIRDPTGRLDLDWDQAIVVDATATRFHPASVAGLVVGSMGMFVFGLYLRRWVKERKAFSTTEHTEVTENDL